MKSIRNKTISLTHDEYQEYKSKLIYLNEATTLENILNKTIKSKILTAIQYFPSTFVDLLFVDPPYNTNKKYNSNFFKKMSDVAYRDWFELWLQPVKKTLKPNASIYICSDWRTSPVIYPILKKYFVVRNRITWERDKGRGAQTNWKNNSEDIWFCTNSSSYTFNVEDVKLRKKVLTPYVDENGIPKDWDEKTKTRLTYPSNLWTDLSIPFWSMPENTKHSTQKPEKLLAKIILASSNEGDIVFDPFVGSGTTSVTAKKLNRNYIGVEEDEEYACLTEKRLMQAEGSKRIQGYESGVFYERNSK